MDAIARLYIQVQFRLSKSKRLQLYASPLPRIKSIQCSHPYMRRLFFFRQCEMLFRLRAIQQSRFDDYEPPIRVRITEGPLDKYKSQWRCQILRGREIIHKNFADSALNTNHFRIYPYLISEDVEGIRMFSDVVYMDAVIEGLRNRAKLNQCGFAHVDDEGENEEYVILRVRFCGLMLQVNRVYWLSERYIDFNTKKSIQALTQATQLTIMLLSDPRQLEKPQAIRQKNEILQREISNMFIKREPTIKPEGLHTLNQAQQKACEHVKNERVTLIWGPPGNLVYFSSIGAQVSIIDKELSFLLVI